MHLSRNQTGLSMIELMVAMVISLVLMLGVTQIYLDNKRSYLFQQNQSENQEGGRFSQLLLQQELTRAGYRRSPTELPENAFPQVGGDISGCGAFTAGQSIKRVSSSSLCIRYHPRDEEDLDCLGNAVIDASKASIAKPYTPTPEIFVERLWLDTDKGELTCTSTHVARNGTVLLEANSGAMVSGVSDLRFELGVGSAAAPREVVEYLTGDPGSNPILTARYSLLMRGSSEQLRDAVEIEAALANWKELTGATAAEVTVVEAADLGHLYQVAQGTVMLRNRMP
ncbi:MAG: prepilin-type N-terminal cleavage/methylation domain-containing protein [Pseudomonadota bacterium]